MTKKNTPKIFGAENDPGISDAELADRIQAKLLRKLERITDRAPEGLVTEVQYKNIGMVYKLSDLTASFKNVAGRMKAEEEAPENGFDFLDDGD